MLTPRPDFSISKRGRTLGYPPKVIAWFEFARSRNIPLVVASRAMFIPATAINPETIKISRESYDKLRILGARLAADPKYHLTKNDIDSTLYQIGEEVFHAWFYHNKTSGMIQRLDKEYQYPMLLRRMMAEEAASSVVHVALEYIAIAKAMPGIRKDMPNYENAIKSESFRRNLVPGHDEDFTEIFYYTNTSRLPNIQAFI